MMTARWASETETVETRLGDVEGMIEALVGFGTTCGAAVVVDRFTHGTKVYIELGDELRLLLDVVNASHATPFTMVEVTRCKGLLPPV